MSKNFGFGGQKSTPKKKSKASGERHIDNHSWHHKDDSFWYTKGRSLVDSKKYEEAIIAFDHAIRCNPKNYNAWNSKGNCLCYKFKRYKDSITAYEKAIKINPNISGLWANKAYSLAKLGEHEQAILAYHTAIKIPSNPDERPKYWNGMGFSYTDLGQYEKSIEAYDRATDINPNYYQAWLNKGISLDKLNRHEDSLEAYNEVIKFDSNNYRAWNCKGISLAKLERYEESLKAYNRAIEIKPDYHEALYNQGVHLYNFKYYRKAIEAFNKVIALNPDYVYWAWHGKGSSLSSLGDEEEAIEAYESAIKIVPNHQSWNGKGIALAQLGQYEESIQAYDNSLTINPKNWMAWINRGTAALHQIDKSIGACLLPLAMQNLNLNQRGFQGQIACINEGFKYVIQEIDLEGCGQLHRAIGNAHYFYGRQQKDTFIFWRKSISSYEIAIGSLTATEELESVHLETLQDLIRVFLGLCESEKAESLLREGTSFLNARLIQKSGCHKEQFEQKFRPRFNDLTVELYVQQGKLIEALEIAEKNKNDFLSALLLANSNEPSPTYAKMCAFLHQHPTTAIIYWHYGDNTITTFLLALNDSSEIVLTLPAIPIEPNAVRVNELKNWITVWQKDYANYGGKARKSDQESKRKDKNHPWRIQMCDRFNNLKTILCITAIEESLKSYSHCTHLLLIPHGDLHLFPLDSLFNPKYTISYLPSIKVGINFSNRSNPSHNHLLSIENPDSTVKLDNGAEQNLPQLTAAEAESELIYQMYAKFSQPTRRAKAETTFKEVVAQITSKNPTPHTVLHFTGHGYYDSLNSIESALALSKNDRLTLREIATLDLSTYKLACLSACETAITGNQVLISYINPIQYSNGEEDLTNIPKVAEYVGIASAFMYSGVANVVSTLWTVESISSALLMIEFHRYYLAGNSAATALATAKHWLRNATCEDLSNWYHQEIKHLPPNHSLIPWLYDRLDDMSASTDSHPYSHLYHWSAFTITGL
ncbi:tetratricopeptide repeat protein [Pseudanabaena sp. BC1403]|uniref:CHAT domain-containing protein n=1 Tax=Pseudanabaena sp. BC1403 TaxID=2043171 RepID=UPI0015E1B12A|nr:CHAT domain-containing tetratricopeptide repeat protein [Pseudanabaena sp. BC1403]